jgi:Fe2+ or Zn2+ uptake regulation protein
MGKKGSDVSKNMRQELILNILETFGTGEGITTSEIYNLLLNKHEGIHKRTLYRDLNELTIRYPISESEGDGKKKWVLVISTEYKKNAEMFREYYQKQILRILNTDQKVSA